MKRSFLGIMTALAGLVGFSKAQQAAEDMQFRKFHVAPRPRRGRSAKSTRANRKQPRLRLKAATGEGTYHAYDLRVRELILGSHPTPHRTALKEFRA